MDQAIQNIYECLRHSEERFIEKTAQLRAIREEKFKEERKLKRLQTETKLLQKEIERLQNESFKLISQRNVQQMTGKVLEEKISNAKKTCKEKTSVLEARDILIEEGVEKFLQDIYNFHDSIRLRKLVQSSKLMAKNQDHEATLEENALKCELKIREDLMKEEETLKEELKRRNDVIRRVEQETNYSKQTILKALKDAVKLKNEIANPQKIPSIHKLEKELEEVEQETEFLKDAILALQKEKRTQEANSKPPKSASRFTFRSITKVSTPKVFKRSAPASTPYMNDG